MESDDVDVFIFRSDRSSTIQSDWENVLSDSFLQVRRILSRTVKQELVDGGLKGAACGISVALMWNHGFTPLMG
jgi:hypothetical protein